MSGQNCSVQKIFAMHDPANAKTDVIDQQRKKCSQISPRELAASFACCVTIQSSFDDMVAKKGSMSIFNAFSKMYPEVNILNCTTICCLKRSLFENPKEFFL